MPKAVYAPRACIRLTLATAERVGFQLDRILFEFTETRARQRPRREHSAHIPLDGFKTAIDDLGAGHAGLGLLTKMQPDIVKLDMDLVCDIDTSDVKQTVVSHALRMLVGITPLCEGIETEAEALVSKDLGVDLLQGHLFAKPWFEALPTAVHLRERPEAAYALQKRSMNLELA